MAAGPPSAEHDRRGHRRRAPLDCGDDRRPATSSATRSTTAWSKATRDALEQVALAFLALALVKPLLQRFIVLHTARAGEGFLADLRTATYNRLQELSLPYFEGERAGVLVSRLTADVQSLTTFVRLALPEIVTNLILLVATLVVLVAAGAEAAPLRARLAADRARRVGRVSPPLGARVPRDPRHRRHDARRAAGALRRRPGDPGVPPRARRVRRLRGAEPRADRRVQARVVRQHRLLPAHRVRAGARARRGARRRSGALRPR